MPGWYLVALAAFLWLALAALVRPVSGRVRLTASAVAVGWAALSSLERLWRPAGGWSTGAWPGPDGPWLDMLGPIAALLGVYAMAGALFTAPQVALERWLLDVDRRLFATLGVDAALARAPRLLLEALELGYLLAYPLVPLGGALLVLDGQGARLPSYWTVVVSSGVACYAALPVLRTRPPRALDARPAYGGRGPRLARLNVALLARVSSQVNTLPSGHAATAVAVLLMTAAHSPPAFAVVLPVGLAIVIATVTGRYHFVVDTVLGVATGVVVWGIAG